MEAAEYELMDTVTKSVIETIGDAGYAVIVNAADGHPVVTAIDEKTGELFIVRGDNLYAAVVELAQQLGFGLDD